MCAEELEKNANVTELVLADARTDAPKVMASRLKSDKISVEKVNGSDPKDLKRLLKGADLVISSMPWQLNRNTLNVAAPLGVNYVDFSMTVDSMEDFKAMVKMCKDCGVTAITAVGEDPGMSDVLAVHGASKLDKATWARVMDGDSGSAEGFEFFSLWSPEDLLEETTVPAAVFRNGKMTFVSPLKEKEIYEFPEPVGPLPVYKTNHEETYLMPEFIKGLKDADFRIAIDDNFAKTVTMLRKMGMHSLNPIDVKGVKVKPLDVVVALMPRPVELAGKVKGHACVVVEVHGKKDGKEAMAKGWVTMSHEKAYEICKSNATGYLVGLGGAIGAEMVMSRDVKQKGLLVPEQLPADKFIQRMKGKGLEVHEELKLGIH